MAVISRQSDSKERGLISRLPSPYCANSPLQVDIIHCAPGIGGYNSCHVVTCGLSRLTRAFPCNTEIRAEQTANILVDQWFKPYRAT